MEKELEIFLKRMATAGCQPTIVEHQNTYALLLDSTQVVYVFLDEQGFLSAKDTNGTFIHKSKSGEELSDFLLI